MNYKTIIAVAGSLLLATYYLITGDYMKASEFFTLALALLGITTQIKRK